MAAEVRIYAGIPASVEQMLFGQPWSDEGLSTQSLSIFLAGRRRATFGDLVETKRNQGESTSATTVDGIALHFTGTSTRVVLLGCSILSLATPS